MATRFRFFRDSIANAERLMAAVNEAMAEIEARGGEYVASHAPTVPSPSGDAAVTVVLVYREAEGWTQPGIM